ncbi:transcriptional regulator [Altererythrobacter salegens]|uniref:Transcriptional regulator n=1 Tax=Croceibacterium salegens TaxID=1737568 RepID=A0A6I4SWZ0_9SPHN|nr:winged helix-turn-helix domain-containing protein [Croceibacterium salegens]MXO59557.1 transcriptional regulator [Croceibacterium salegens]
MGNPAAVTYKFGDFALDEARFELCHNGEPVPCEPQVLSLLLLLCANSDRLVDKDEIVEKVWDGRIVSEAAISARIKSARKAIGDDGAAQRLIKTIHGRGFRFIGDLEFVSRAEAEPAQFASGAGQGVEAAGSQRPSIAVLPLRRIGEPGPYDFIADAMPDELIMDLSRLRSLFVIARGSSFRFRDREVGDALGVRYLLGGSVEKAGNEIVIRLELSDTVSGSVLWAEAYRSGADELQQLRSEILRQVVMHVEIRIAQNEAQLARAQQANSLGSWSAYHLGLDHMFRFNRADTDLAADYFRRALETDPHFARAYGGLSFTSFQRAFMRFDADRDALVSQARDFAQQAIDNDRLDPFSHFNMGRSFWLEGDLDRSRSSLSHAVELCPNFAQGVYVHGLASTLAGDTDTADDDLRHAIALSPLDPLRYAMIGSRSFVYTLRGDYEKAAELGIQAALTPGAHKHIDVIAAIGTALAGRRSEAEAWVARAHSRDTGVSAADFLKSFPFAQGEGRELIERTLADLGL